MSHSPDVLSAVPPHPPPSSADNAALSSAPDSPMVPSPDSAAASEPDVKIDTDYLHRESDERSHQLTIPIDKIDVSSTHPQLGTPADPSACFSLSSLTSGCSSCFCCSLGSIPISVPKGTPPPPTGELLLDVQMSEQVQTNGNGLNGLTNGHTAPEDDMNMDIESPAADETTPSLPNHNGVNGASHSDDADDRPPPAKRARKLSDAEQASITHVRAPYYPLLYTC